MVSKKYIGFIIVAIVFAGIFCSVSLINHYLFRTYAYDLGLNNNAIYDYAHFRWNDCMLMQPQFDNILSDHFSLIPLLVSPLYWIFGTYTMLIVQILGILFGGLGIYVYFLERTGNLWISNLAAVHFFSIWGIYSALAFDYHDNVMAAMFVPWFLHYFNKGQWQKSLPFFLLILVSKENMALWMIFICLGLLIHHLMKKKNVVLPVLFLFSALIYFVAVVKLVIPSMANEGREYLHFHYSALGENFSDAIKTILTRPLYVFSLLFNNHMDDPIGNGVKAELHYMVLWSGGFALLFRPQYLVMLIPVYAQKLFNDDFVKWGLNAQYSIEFVPILTIALFSLVSWIKNVKFMLILAVVSVICTMYSTGSKLDKRISEWYNPEAHQFYEKGHYTRGFDVKELYDALKLIPDTAKLSAQSFIVPHVAMRDYIYQYPVINDASYIIFMTGESSYPLNDEEFGKKTEEYLASTAWENIYKKNNTFIFRKK